MCSMVFYKTFLGVELSLFLKVQRLYQDELRVLDEKQIQNSVISQMEGFVKIVNDLNALKYFTRSPILVGPSIVKVSRLNLI